MEVGKVWMGDGEIAEEHADILPLCEIGGDLLCRFVGIAARGRSPARD